MRRLLELVRFVAPPRPLPVLLDEVPERIASVVDADVASLYLLEPDGSALVMRGTVGFPLGVRGKVRLAVGEGITGLAVQAGRPITAQDAPGHTSYRRFDELDEDRFPIFLAVPVLGSKGALGALVVQRASAPFKPSEVHLVTALTAPIASALERARLPDHGPRKAGGGTRRVTLTGLPLAPGRVLGAVHALRRPATTSRTVATGEDRAALEAAFDGARRELDRLAARAQELAIGADAAFLDAYRVILSDARLRELAFEEVERGESVPKALGTVARTATRAASLRGDGDAFLKERARDIEDLCDALVMLASPDARAAVPTGAVLVGDDLGVFDLLVTRRFRPFGLALSERVLDEHGSLRPRVRVLAELLGVPTVVSVKGLFEWVSPGDLALLDADHGIVVVNPPRTDIAAVRAERKKIADRASKPEA